MGKKQFRAIDLAATGANIERLRRARGLSVRDVQEYFCFDSPQAIYKWQWGKSLPSLDNLYGLSDLLEVPIEQILVAAPVAAIAGYEPQDPSCGSHSFWRCPRILRCLPRRQASAPAGTAIGRSPTGRLCIRPLQTFAPQPC